MLSNSKKLQISAAVGTLLVFAFGVGCNGFFVDPTLTSITVSPASPQVPINQTLSMSVYGTYNDGSQGLVKTGVSWSSSDPTTVSVGATSGIATGVALGTATITANAQGVSATASATVYLTGITKITVSPGTWSFSNAAGGSQTFTATATASGTNLDISTTGAVWTLTPTTTGITCAPSTDEVCTATASGTQVGTYTLTASYPGTSVVGTATINVGP